MKRIYICSPLSAKTKKGIRKNVKRAVEYGGVVARAELGNKYLPVVPHTLALMLDDDNPKHREAGIAFDMRFLALCEEVWVFGEELTDGMKREIDAKRLAPSVWPDWIVK